MVPDVNGGLQETFTREGLRQLLKAYEAGQPLKPLRASLGGTDSWDHPEYRDPAPRVDWTKEVATEPKAAVSAKPIQHDYDDDEDDDEEVAAEPVAQSPEPSVIVEPPAPIQSIPEPTPVVVFTPQAPDQTIVHPASPTPAAGSTTIDDLIAAHAQKAHEDSAEEQTWLDTTAQKLRSALMGYNLQAKVLGTRLTPNAALIRFMGSDRLRVEDIEAKQSALLTTHGLRLISVSPLPGEIVVGVARPQRQVVSLWDVWGRREVNRNAAGVNTSFVLGLKELDGDILYLNLGGAFAGGQPHEPHTLVAGATGSGKSVLIQALLLDIAATNSSALAHIYLIDPKMGVDYAAIEQLPHLQGGVIVDQSSAADRRRRSDLAGFAGRALSRASTWAANSVISPYSAGLITFPFATAPT